MKKQNQNNTGRRTFLNDLGKTIFYAGISASILPSLTSCVKSVEGGVMDCGNFKGTCTGYACDGTTTTDCGKYSFNCTDFRCGKDNECGVSLEHNCIRNICIKGEFLCLMPLTKFDCSPYSSFDHRGGRGS